MGFSISWVALKGLSKTEALSRLGLVDSGEPDEFNESPISIAALPSGWLIVVSNDVEHFLDDMLLQRLSRDCELLCCAVEEHCMLSIAIQYLNGQEKWAIRHEGDGDDIFHLVKAGILPEFYAQIEDDMMSTQRNEGGRDAGVDYIFEIPLLTAKEVCGYKHDESNFAFTALETN